MKKKIPCTNDSKVACICSLRGGAVRKNRKNVREEWHAFAAPILNRNTAESGNSSKMGLPRDKSETLTQHQTPRVRRSTRGRSRTARGTRPIHTKKNVRRKNHKSAGFCYFREGNRCENCSFPTFPSWCRTPQTESGSNLPIKPLTNQGSTLYSRPLSDCPWHPSHTHKKKRS